MWHYIKEHVKPFWIGFTGSGVVWGNILFADAGHIPGPVLVYLLKLVGAAAIAFASGLATVAATDFYKELKLRYKKYKNGKREKNNSREAEEDGKAA